MIPDTNVQVEKLVIPDPEKQSLSAYQATDSGVKIDWMLKACEISLAYYYYKFKLYIFAL